MDALYAKLAEGEDVVLPPHSAGPLLHLARRAALSVEVADRLGALRVAAVLSVENGLRVTDLLVTDSSYKVRRYAFNQAVAARYAGLPLIRRFASDPEPGLAAEAIGLLIRTVDMQSTPVMRRLLRSPTPEVRAAAATLLGHVSGPAIKVELGRLLREDGDDAVRVAADQALQRIAGTLARATPGRWWDDPVESEVEDEDGPALPPPPPVPEFNSLLPPPPTAATPLARGPMTTLTPPPQLPATAPTALPSSAPEPSTPTAALPAQLPDEPSALLKLLGMVAVSDHQLVLDALRGFELIELGRIVLSVQPGGDPARARGCALAAAGLERTSWLSAVRRLTFDANAGVRAASAAAIGALAGPSGIPNLASLLSDPSPQVRLAALRGLRQLCTHVERLDIVRQWADRLMLDADPAVAEIASQIRAELE